jgi:DNA-binding response OmpR family regulator
MQPETELARYRILVAEDDAMMHELITTRLELAGYRTLHARDGLEALTRLRDAPSAMLLDINMPNLDGFGVLREMRKLGYLNRVPTMVLTARNQTADVQEAVKLGARDFMTKPFETPTLLSRVARLLRQRPAAPAVPTGQRPTAADVHEI